MKSSLQYLVLLYVYLPLFTTFFKYDFFLPLKNYLSACTYHRLYCIKRIIHCSDVSCNKLRVGWAWYFSDMENISCIFWTQSWGLYYKATPPYPGYISVIWLHLKHCCTRITRTTKMFINNHKFIPKISKTIYCEGRSSWFHDWRVSFPTLSSQW